MHKFGIPLAIMCEIFI